MIQILKKYGSVIFDEESIYEISKPYLKFETVFDILSFLWQNLQRAITQKNKMFFFFFKFSPGNLLLILYKLSKFEAPSCNGL